MARKIETKVPAPESEPDDNILSRIRTSYKILTKSQRRIADYICAHQDVVMASSITALSRKIGTNPPALTRFCQAIHYKGFGEFKFCLEKALVAPLGTQLDVTDADGVHTIKGKLMDMQREAVADTLLPLDERQVARAVKVICEASMVHIYGDGGPAATCNFAYQLLLQVGVRCDFFTDSNISAMAAGQLRKGDVAIGITYSGFSAATIRSLSVARQCGAVIIGMTARTNSPVAKLSDIPLCYSLKITDDIRYMHIARICEIAIIGVLQSAIINRDPERVAKQIEFAKKAIVNARGYKIEPPKRRRPRGSK